MGNAAVQVAAAIESKIRLDSPRPSVVRRGYVPMTDLAELGDMPLVTVVPRSQAIINAARGVLRHEVIVDVSVQKRVSPNDLAAVDDVMAFVAELIIVLRNVSFPELGASWLGIANEPLFVAEHLQNEHVVTSVLSVTYAVKR